ncbi:MAG: hypothetical protein V3S05_10815 [Desulfobacterales bacterium]
MKKAMMIILGIFGILGVLVAVPVSAAETPSVDEIVNRANLAAYYAGNDGRAEVTMTIIDAQGRTRKREFVILRRDLVDGGRQQFYVYFKKLGVRS